MELHSAPPSCQRHVWGGEGTVTLLTEPPAQPGGRNPCPHPAHGNPLAASEPTGFSAQGRVPQTSPPQGLPAPPAGVAARAGRWRGGAAPDEPSGHPAGAPACRTEWSQFIAFRKILSTCNSVTFRMVSHIKNCGNFEIWRCKNTESWKLRRVGLRLLTRGKACSREVPNARENRCDRFTTRTRIRCRAA